METKSPSIKVDTRDSWEKIYDMCIELENKFPTYFTSPGAEPLWKYIWGNPTMYFHYTTKDTYPGVLRNQWVFMDTPIKGLPHLPEQIRESFYDCLKEKKDLQLKVFSKTYQH